MQLLKQGDHKEVAMAQDDVHEEIEKTPETHQDKVVTDSIEGVGSAGGSLFVSNLSRNVTSGHLREIFGYYGNVKNVDLKYDRKNRQSKGQATISFQTEKDAEHAMFYLDGGQIDGSEIKVSFVLVEQDHNRGSSSPVAQKSDHRENEGKDRRRPEDSERNQTTSAQGREADRRPPADSMRDERERGGQGQGRPRNTNQPTSNQPPANHRRDEPMEGGFRRRSRSPPQRGRERDFRDRDSRYGPPASRPANDNYPNRRGGENGGPVRRSRSRDRRGDPPLNNNRRNPPPPINRGRSRSRSGGRRPVNPRDQRFNGNRNAPINRDRERERDRSRDRDNRRHRSPSRSISRSRSRSPAYRRRRGSRSSSSRSRSKSPASSNSSDSRYRKRRRSPSSSRSRSRSHSSRSRSRSSKSSRSSYRSRRSRSRDSNRSRRSASSHRSEGRDDKRGDGDEGETTKKED